MISDLLDPGPTEEKKILAKMARTVAHMTRRFSRPNDMDKLEQRRTLQSLILSFKCFKLYGPNYISQFFTPRLTKYNRQDSGLNVVQPP